MLPALAWAVSRLVAAGSLRDGVMAVGLAPCEIASVATTAMAGGEAALAAGVLIGSTFTSVAFAGPVLTLEAGHGGVRPGGIIANLALVVALPLAVGIALRAGVLPVPSGAGDRPRPRHRPRGTGRLGHRRVRRRRAGRADRRRGPPVGALRGRRGSAGAVPGRLGPGGPPARRSRRPPGRASALLLTTSMRDFAMAAGLATAAFGPAAAAPLGLYGILVLVWGTAVAGVLRSRARVPLSGQMNVPCSCLWPDERDIRLR